MNGFLLLIPFLLIRFGVLSHLDRAAVKRAAFFAPMAGKEIAAYWIYQLSNAAIFIVLFFLKVPIDFSWQFWSGTLFYLLGLVLCTASVIDFAAPSGEGLNQNGLYRFSRNPMYLSYFFTVYGLCPAHAFCAAWRNRYHIPAVFPLDYSFRGTVVHWQIRGCLQAVYEKGKAVYIEC